MNIYFNKIIKKRWATLVATVAIFLVVFILNHRFHNEKSSKPCTPAGSEVPLRIVSTSLASDELLVRILREAGQMERLAAVSAIADDPVYSHISTEARAIPARVGDNLESIASLKPDLVVFSSFNRPAVTTALAGMAVRTCWLEKFSSLADIQRNAITLGRATGLAAAADRVAAGFLADMQAAQRATNALSETARPRVLSYDGSGTVLGAGTTFDELVQLAGGVNAAANLRGWPRVSDEALNAMAPDIIVLITDTRSREDLVASLQSTPGWRETPAVKNGQFVAPVPADLLSLAPDALRAVPVMRAAFQSSIVFRPGADTSQ